MKFKIRYADQIIGFSIIIAILSIAFVIMMMGGTHRWFARNIYFVTEFSSATGLSQNMPVLYRGFTIGNVASFNLTDNDMVTVNFFIYEEYSDRVRPGSMVELMVSPIGLGNQFLFHPGIGTGLVPEGGFIPDANSPEARNLVRQGLANAPWHDDSISLLLNRASSVLAALDDAFRTGTEATTIGRTMAGIEGIPDAFDRTADSVIFGINNIVRQLNALEPILRDLNTISAMMADPDGSVASFLDADGEIYVNLVSSLSSIAGILEDLERTASFIPGQLPQLAGLVTDLRVALRSAQDVIIALTNNPLLRRGIPERIDVQSSGTSPRDIRF